MVPPGNLKLYEVVSETEKVLIQEFVTSSFNRSKINELRNDLLMIHPTKTYIIVENNAIR